MKCLEFILKFIGEGNGYRWNKMYYIYWSLKLGEYMEFIKLFYLLYV